MSDLYYVRDVFFARNRTNLGSAGGDRRIHSSLSLLLLLLHLSQVVSRCICHPRARSCVLPPRRKERGQSLFVTFCAPLNRTMSRFTNAVLIAAAAVTAIAIYIAFFEAAPGPAPTPSTVTQTTVTLKKKVEVGRPRPLNILQGTSLSLPIYAHTLISVWQYIRFVVHVGKRRAKPFGPPEAARVAAGVCAGGSAERPLRRRK